jgi:hypothetical protein
MYRHIVDTGFIKNPGIHYKPGNMPPALSHQRSLPPAGTTGGGKLADSPGAGIDKLIDGSEGGFITGYGRS